MLNKDFYPTPFSVIQKMITTEHRKNIRTLQILEPSAGKGDILDYLTKYGDQAPAKNLYAIESDPELIATLQGKKYKVIHTDFLSYANDYKFDLILMNPPFSNGVDHILHAWKIAENTDIVCILNEETIKNPYTEKRKLLLKLIEDHGQEPEYLGNAFYDAERKTNVNVCIVRLKKWTEKGTFDFNFENVTTEAGFQFSEEAAGNGIMINDIMGNMIRQYEKTKKAYINYTKAKSELSFYGSGLIDGHRRITEIAEEAYQGSRTDQGSFNLFVDEFKLSAWKKILKSLNIEKYLTNKVLSNFREYSVQQGAMDLTKENIHELIMLLANNHGKIMTDAVVEVFDIFTKFHKQNRKHFEGWKTNDAFKVNQKIILPYFVESSWHGFFNVMYSKHSEYTDIDKVMCYLTGKNFDDFKTPLEDYKWNTPDREKDYLLTSLEHAIKCTKYGDSSWQDSEFFEFRCFKKGTIHLKFKDEKLWEKFNLEAARGKNWLPQAKQEPAKHAKKKPKPQHAPGTALTLF